MILNKHLKVLFFFTLAMGTPLLHGQDPSFSQFYANRLYLNPAFAGVEQDVRRAFINYRNQWPGINARYVTYSASYDQYIDPLRGGFGVRVMNDIQGEGTINQFEFGLIYSHQIRLSRELVIAGGLEAHVVQRSLNTSEMVFEDMIDPQTGIANMASSENISGHQRTFPDFNLGFAGFYRNVYLGASLSHLLSPDLSESSSVNNTLPRKFMFFAGGMIPVREKRFGKENLQLSPNIVYIQQKKFSQLNYGMEAVMQSRFIAGIWIRQNPWLNFSGLIFSGGYVTNNYRIRYSYDQQLSAPEVSLPALGSHEISLIISFKERENKKHRAIKCPKI